MIGTGRWSSRDSTTSMMLSGLAHLAPTDEGDRVVVRIVERPHERDHVRRSQHQVFRPGHQDDSG